jgi:hypothetical protein
VSTAIAAYRKTTLAVVPGEIDGFKRWYSTEVAELYRRASTPGNPPIRREGDEPDARGT